MGDLVRDWYIVLSRLSAQVAIPVDDLASRLQLPLASAFLFGLIGAVAPCQLTTNASAMAYLSRDGARRSAGVEAGAFALAKVLVYTAIGALALLFGTAVQTAAIPVAQVARKAIGPVLLLVGLAFLGLFRLRGGFGARLAARFGARTTRQGPAGAFLMGGAFAFAFCPTLFWLFFGLTLPLALASPAGFVAPALFAAGTSVPVLLLGGLMAAGAVPAAQGPRFSRASRWLTRISGAVLVLLGVHDTLIYWVL